MTMKRFFQMSDDGKGDLLKSNIIVWIFVFAHAVTCFFLHDTKVGDGIFLTVLTIAMVFALIRFYRVSFDVFLGLAFLSCFAGFYLGTEGAEFLERQIPSWGVWINVIVTVLTTELLGLVIILLIRKDWNEESRRQ